MKKLIFVNNNLQIGGVQKSLVNLLKMISGKYDITLLLFSDLGEYAKEIPESIKVIKSDSLFKCLGKSQNECKKNFVLYIIRGILALVTKKLGRRYAMKFILNSQKRIDGEYDCAISFLQNGGDYTFYGGCNEFVLEKIKAKRKISFLHCDFKQSGADTIYNKLLYAKFDKIAACSVGCMNSFISVLPELKEKVNVVTNCHDFDEIILNANKDSIIYSKDVINVISIARLNYEKGIDRSIKAIDCAIKQGNKVKYHIVGDGIQRKELESLANELGIQDDVMFYGNSENPYKYLKNADLLLIPSYHEAAPLVIDEAICLKVPVLSTLTTSSREMICDRNIGWVCENCQEELNKVLYILTKNEDKILECKKYLESFQYGNEKALKEFCELVE